jgi:tetratricopeptide (TPR) repeat protein
MTQPASKIRRAPTPESTAGRRRVWRQWATAVPALGAIAFVLLFAMLVTAQSDVRTIDRYKQEAAAASASQDFKTARVCYERLLQTDGNNPALLFGLATSLEGLGQEQESLQIIQRLAPLDAAGYAPAHLLLAERLLSNSPTPEAIALAEKHLHRALEADPNNAEAQTVLSTVPRTLH